MKISLIAVVLVLSSIVFAGGNEIGNGGGIIKCSQAFQEIHLNPEGEFYDSFETRARYLNTLDFKNIDLNADSIVLVKQLINRIGFYNDNLKYDLLRSVDSFFKEARLVNQITIPPTNDYGFMVIPKECSFIQLIVQVEPKSSLDSRYWVDFNLWTKLSNYDQAVAILHEVIYRKVDKSKTKYHSSEGVRYFVGLFLSNSILKLSIDDFCTLLTDLGLNEDDYTCRGAKI